MRQWLIIYLNVYILRSLLHPCLIDSMHLVHSHSNLAGEFHYEGNKVNIWFFRGCTSCSGRPGGCRSPAKVHLIMVDSPKNDSLASLSASVDTSLSWISFGFLSMTTLAGTSLIWSIADDGRCSWWATFFPLWFKVACASVQRSCAFSGQNWGRFGVFWWERWDELDCTPATWFSLLISESGCWGAWRSLVYWIR